jgi:tRNA threonylcarbamoyladenosine biosynthesis protein TsaE
MFVLHTSTPAETQAVAAALAALAEPGDLVLLSGDLGAGKTTFTQGFARALGVTGPVTSPTFTLHRRYDGRLRLHHLDVYRLEHLAELQDLDVPELLEGDTVTLVEWGDTVSAALPADRLELRLSLGAGDDERLLELRPVGRRWTARHPALVRALAPWEAPAATVTAAPPGVVGGC